MNNVSQQLSVHPVHLTQDKEGNLPPSALIPFCSYQGDSSLLGQQLPELDNMTTCGEFQATVLEGQLCYSLDVAKLIEKPSRPGKQNGLFLLLDPRPYSVNGSENNRGVSRTEQESFKVSVHTLAQYTTTGPGSYGMSDLKKIVTTKSFDQLPDHQKKCHTRNREECQTEKYFDAVKRECKCLPWALAAQNTNQVILNEPLSQIVVQDFPRSLPSVAPKTPVVLQTKP